METIIFAALSAILIWGYVHEDWFVRQEDRAARLAAILASRLCKKILQILHRCGKLEQTKRKEDHHACHIKRIQSFGDPIRQQVGERNARRAG